MFLMRDLTTWQTFIEESRKFFDANRGCPMFKLIETLDELYRAVHEKAPFPATGAEKDDFTHMCFLICHRALLSAAMSTGSGLPEDAQAVTRRALEAAKVTFAIKVDPENFEIWKATEVRKSRWEARAQGIGTHRRPVNTQYKGVSGQPLYEDLQTVIAVLSDYTVHFTPEHVHGYEWEQTSHPDGTSSMAFGVKEDTVATELLMIVDQHRLILRIFDHCLDEQLYKDAQVKQIAQKAFDQYKDLLQREGLTEEATTIGAAW